MSRVVVVVGLLLVTACRTEPPLTVPLTPVLTSVSSTVDCEVPMVASDLPDAVARFHMIGSVIAAIREDGCAMNDDRLCRDLFLIGATDPLAGLAAGLDDDQFDQLAEWHRWALADAAIAADLSGDGATSQALRRIDGIAAGVTSASSPAEIADVAVARADRSIIEPLAAAETSCLN